MSGRDCPAKYCAGTVEEVGDCTYQCPRCRRIVEVSAKTGQIVGVYIRKRKPHSTEYFKYLDKKTMAQMLEDEINA